MLILSVGLCFRTLLIPYLAVYQPSPCNGKERKPKYKIPNRVKDFLRIYERM